jgi:hypothetical protein
MTFTPIPGVWYIQAEAAIRGFRLEDYEPELLVAYLPGLPNGSWYSPGNGLVTDADVEQLWPDLVQVHNPHSPTHPEQAIRYDGSGMHMTGPPQLYQPVREASYPKEMLNRLRQLHPEAVLVERQVTEWVEVGDE